MLIRIFFLDNKSVKRHKSASPTPTETWFSGIEAKRARSSEVADDSIIIPYAAPSCDPPEHTRIKRQMSPSLSLSAEQEPTKRARVSSSAAGNEDDNNLILPFSNLSIPATRAAKKRQISPPPPSSTEDTFPETKRVHVSSSSGENVPKHDKIPTPVVPLEKLGRVFVFGTGDAGQLGLGDEIDERRKPTPVRTLDKEEIVDIVCGGLHTLAISKDGKVSYNSDVYIFKRPCLRLDLLLLFIHSFGVGAATTKAHLADPAKKAGLTW